MQLNPILRKVTEIGIGFTAIATLFLAGCGGGGGGSTPASNTPATIAMSGVAAVGSPIVGGTIKLNCATGSALTTSTDTSGNWQVTLSGQTLPCAVQVSGGTINGVANSTPYHAIATTSGTVNVTPLTDLIVANLAGASTPSTWFSGLNSAPAPLATITQTNVDSALTKLRAAFPTLTPLASINPITTSFTAISGNASDDMLVALKTAMTNTAVTHAALLSNAAVPAFNPPVSGFGTALTTAYAGTSSGGGGTGGAGSGSSGTPPLGTLFVTNAPSYVGDFTPTVPTAGTLANGGIALTTISWTEPHIPNVVIEQLNMTFHLSGTALPVGTPSSIEYWAADATSSVPAALINCNATPALCAGVVHDNVAHTVTFTNFVFSSVTMNGTLSYSPSPSASIPSTPSNVTATAVGETQINLGWTAVTGATGYNVYRSTATGVAGSKITASPVTSASFNNSGLSSSTPYYYKVTAVNAVGESLGSAEVTATTNAPAVVVPAVTGYTPSSGSISSTVTITGTDLNGFLPPAVVKFGTTVATTNLVNNQTLTATVPVGLPLGNHTITIANGDGTGAISVGSYNVTLSVSTLAGSGTRGTLNGTGTGATFNGPTGLVATGGNIYVADGYVIRRVEIATGIVTNYAGATNAYSPLDGTGTAASFSMIRSLATDGTNLYVSESANVIRKIDIASGVVNTLAGTPNNLGGYADGTGTAAAFNGVFGMTFMNGNLYVTELYNHVIRKIDVATGTVISIAGTANNVGSFADGVGALAAFNQPLGITNDSNYLYVADASNRLIRRINVTSTSVETVAGTYPPSGAIGDGVGLLAQFSGPQGMHYDATCLCIFLVDAHTVRKFDLTTTAVVTLAGASWGSAEGIGTAARFNTPKYITGDGVSLFVSDFGNYKIRKIQ